MSLLSQFTKTELDALSKVFEMAVRHNDTGGGSTLAKLLLGLYNGRRFPFDLTDLRRLDPGNFSAAMQVISMDVTHFRAEVHVVIAEIWNATEGEIGNVFENWAYDYGLPGRGLKRNLRPPVRFDFSKAI